jgi:uncharacterized protein (TIGR03435 family)
MTVAVAIALLQAVVEMTFVSLALFGFVARGQPAPTFDVASVKPSSERVGPDYNNRISYLAAGISARNATIKRLVAEAYHLQLNQVLGPAWIDQNEYDLEAQAGSPSSKEQLSLMLRELLTDRFQLKLHSELRNMSVYDLVVAKGGPKIQPEKPGSAGPTSGNVFRGDMLRLADLIALQLTFPARSGDATHPVLAGGPQRPVLDKTNLPGTYSFVLDIKAEPDTDGFTLWQRILQDRLGLKLVSSRRDTPVVVIDMAVSVPTEN